MSDRSTDRPDSDPSFIRKDADELINFARRLGLSQQEMRAALDDGLIRPAAGGTPRIAQPRDEPAESRSEARAKDRPQG